MHNAMNATGTIFDIVTDTTQRYDETKSPYDMYEPGFFFSIISQLQALLNLSPDFVVEPASEPLWLILAKTLTGGTCDCYGAEFLLIRYPRLQSLNHLEQGSLPWLTAIWSCFSAHCLDPTGEVFQHVLLKALGVECRPFSRDGEIASGFLNYLRNILVSNLLFVTIRRHVGLAPKDVRRGDFVAIFNGCRMPYVVRRARKVKYKDELYEGHQVVGPCYLHGIMTGKSSRTETRPGSRG